MPSIGEDEIYVIPGSREWYLDRTYGRNDRPVDPAQAAANRNALATEMAYFTPVIGEALSAREAWDASLTMSI